MLKIPEGYLPRLDIRNTEAAIKQIKDCFEKKLAQELNLTRVSAPLFVFPSSGLNDNLNGVERPVKFDVKGIKEEVEVIHSLAKWKRFALSKYDFSCGEGIYADMNAIRRDEDLDNLHSIYVDQWDFEIIIDKAERNYETLTSTVKKIFEVFKRVEKYITSLYPELPEYLPEEITFISTLELEDMYPNLSPKEREDEITKKHGAVFLTEIGGKLKSGKPHDGRAPDYDDWSLNGDILLWYPVLETALEVCSMGVRVDEDTLYNQLEISGCLDRKDMNFHRMVLNNLLPYTIGGGLGQSRICMFFLGKAHIGEVQAAVWPDEMINTCAENNIRLL